MWSFKHLSYFKGIGGKNVNIFQGLLKKKKKVSEAAWEDR